MFLNDPEKLMRGKVGLSLADRFATMADEGKIARDPSWTAPPAKPETPAIPAGPMVDAQGQPIRSMPAYQGGIAKNIAKEMRLMDELDKIDPIVMELGEGPNRSFSRGSELPRDVYKMDDAALARAAAIRAELANMKQPKGKAAQ